MLYNSADVGFLDEAIDFAFWRVLIARIEVEVPVPEYDGLAWLSVQRFDATFFVALTGTTSHHNATAMLFVADDLEHGALKAWEGLHDEIVSKWA